MVAMRGSIMPEPFAMPTAAQRLPATRKLAPRAFGRVSVVMIARAARGRPCGESAAAASRMPASIFASGSGIPITPVEAQSTSRSASPSARAASAHMRSAARSPAAPIATFETPLFATIARARPPRSLRRETTTGALGTVERVNTPAACAGRSLTSSARSGPRRLMPQRTPAKRKPATAGRSGSVTACVPLPRLRCSLVRPTALLVLPAAAARTRVVPARARGRGRAGRAGRRRTRLGQPRTRVGRLPRRSGSGRHTPRRRRGRRGTQLRRVGQHELEHQLRHLVVDALAHLLEQLEALALVLELGVLLRIAAQRDALAQPVHRVQVVLPLAVGDAQQDLALVVGERGVAELAVLLGQRVAALALLLEHAHQPLEHRAAERLAIRHRPERRRGRIEGHAELALEHAGQARQLLVGGLAALGPGHAQLEHERALDDLAQLLVHVAAAEDLAALPVEALALLIGDVVVVEQVLAHVEVAGFDLLLRVLDRARHHAVLDCLAVLEPEPLHPRLDLVAAEDAHQVVFERQVELRRARVALAAGAAAQLVVDAAALVPLRAEDVQAARRDHLLALLRALRLELGEQARVVRVVLVAAALRKRQVLRVAAEEDVGAAAGHVGRDRDGAEAAGLRHDLGLAVVLLRVQY